VTERLEPNQVAVEALPAIALEHQSARATPFGRRAPIHQLTAADAALLGRAPVRLKVLVPVTIGK
jgi:hypothetical protein